MYCQIKGCRFSHSHTTRGHQCGRCNRLGHGQQECGNRTLLNLLNQYQSDRLPFYLQCKIKNCKGKWTHTTEAHYCEFCKKRTNNCEHCGEIENIIEKTCPSCKVFGKIDLNTELYTGGECLICMEDKKMIVFENCKHANICKECCLQLD